MASIPDFRTALQPQDSDPSASAPFWAKGAFAPVWTFAKSGQKAEALTEANRILAVENTTPADRHNIAQWFGEQGAWDRAYHVYNEDNHNADAIRALMHIDPKAAVARAMSSVFYSLPDDLLISPSLRDFAETRLLEFPAIQAAFEERHRPWERLNRPEPRPLRQLESLYGHLERYAAFPMTQAHLRLAAVKVAIEVERWDEATQVLSQIDHPSVQGELPALRDAIDAGRTQPSPSGIALLRSRIVSASDAERGPLEAELGLRLCLEGDLQTAYAHIEEAVMYVSRKEPYYNLLMDVAVKIEDEQPLPDALLENIRTLVDQLSGSQPKSQANQQDADDAARKWTSLLSHLKSLMFSERDRRRAWRRYGRKFDTEFRELGAIARPTADELAALTQLVESLQHGR